MDEHEIRHLLIDEREKMRKDLRGEVDSLFKKEREIIQERTQLYITVGKWFGFGVAVILAVLGWSKAEDIQNTITEYLKKQVDNHYQFDDPNSALSTKLDEIVDHTTVGSIYIESKAAKEYGSAPQNLTYNRRQDIIRLLKITRNQSTDSATFSQAVEGIKYLTDSREAREFATKALLETLRTTTKDDDTIEHNIDKITAILGFPDSDNICDICAEAVKLIEKHKDLPETLQGAAIALIHGEEYTPGENAAIYLAKTTEDERLRFYSIRTLALLNPTHPELKKLVYDYIITLPQQDRTKNLFIAYELLISGNARSLVKNSNARDEKNKAIEEVAVPIVENVLDTINPTIYYNTDNQKISFHSKYLYYSTLDDSIFGSAIITPLLTRANNISEEKFKARVKSILPINTRSKLVATLNEDSKIQTDNGETVSAKNITGQRVEIIATSFSDVTLDDKILLKWTSLNGTVQLSGGRLISPESFILYLN